MVVAACGHRLVAEGVAFRSLEEVLTGLVLRVEEHPVLDPDLFDPGWVDRIRVDSG